MKKLIYALTLSLVCGGVASAVAPKSSIEGRIVKKSAIAASQAKGAVKINPDGTKAQHKVKSKVTAQDFYGIWQWSGENGLSKVILPNEGVMTISPMENSDSILIQGFDLRADLYSPKGGVLGYFKNNRLYIPNQITCFDGETYEDEDGEIQSVEPGQFINTTLRNFTEEEKKEFEENPENADKDVNDYARVITAPEGYDFFFAINQNGNLTCIQYTNNNQNKTDQELLEGFSMANEVTIDMEGTWWACSHIVGSPIEMFEFNPAEWASIGEATYTDGWMRYAYNPDAANATQEVKDYVEYLSQPYQVECYRNNLNPFRFLLYDPYGPGTPAGEAGENTNLAEEGFIVFDITDPECVIVEPFVYTLTIDMGDGTESVPVSMYCYNNEAYSYVIEGMSIQQIINSLDIKMLNVSNFKKSSRTVNLYNPRFDLLPLYSLANPLSWRGVAAAKQKGTIVLPEDYDAVETILGDDSNAPAVYYNLQGVRVNNPEKGQLVIVRKGNKAQKVIM